MKKWNQSFAMAALAALLLTTQGCSLLGVPLGTSKPRARFAALSLRDIGLEAATLNLGVELENPMRQALALAGVEYSLATTENAFLEGQTDVNSEVAAGKKKIFNFPVQVNYAQVLQALSGVRPGAVTPYEARLGLKIKGPFGAPLTIPLRKKGRLPIPAMPQIRNVEVQWDRLNLLKAAGKVRLELVNRNQFPLTLSNLDYALNLGGVQVARSSLSRRVSFGADGGAGLLEIPIEVSPAQLGLAAVQMLGGSEVLFDFEGMLKGRTPYGDMALPLTRRGAANARASGGGR